MNIDNSVRKFILARFGAKISYSQTGEDLILESIFDGLRMRNPSYIDIGAFDPKKASNTALLYLKGSRGINIEPNPELFRNFLTQRKEDINLNIGLHEREGKMDYYVMDSPTLNTFSRDEAESLAKNFGHKIVGTKQIEVSTLARVLDRYCGGKFPDFMSLDAEGVDEIIVNSIDYGKNCPKVICAETIFYHPRLEEGKKNVSLIQLIESKGYALIADTNINSIFVRKEIINR